MADFYDARGNTYFVASPDEIRQFASLPQTVAEAAAARADWAVAAIEKICSRPNTAEASHKPYLSDGLLVGPFPDGDALGLLIVNTDGTLAERSGNGLTIFSQFLTDTGRVDPADTFMIRIHHDKPPVPLVEARIEPTVRDSRNGFWIDMGVPTFGLAAVSADSEHVALSEFEGQGVFRVFDLEQIEPAWIHSQFVNVGNPHCVTFLKSADQLPSMEQLGSKDWLPRLTAIANSTESEGAPGHGRPCKNGVNLQWACVIGPDTVDARVFERGEGPTLSSGSSATAVASAARMLGLLGATTVNVAMPGGVAPIRFDESNGILERVMLFGEAHKTNY
jgi:diaminopimelate epimerase